MTENGFAVKGESNLTIEEALEDKDRLEYFKGYTEAVRRAVVEDGVDVKAYFAWSE